MYSHYRATGIQTYDRNLGVNFNMTSNLMCELPGVV